MNKGRLLSLFTGVMFLGLGISAISRASDTLSQTAHNLYFISGGLGIVVGAGQIIYSLIRKK